MNKEHENDPLKTKSEQDDRAKQRMDEIKKSNEVIGAKNVSDNFYIPKRKIIEPDQEPDPEIIKPRKIKSLPFSDEKIKEIESTITNIKEEYKTIELQNKIITKQLLKEETKWGRLVQKTNKKLSSLLEKNKEEELEKTMELYDEYAQALKKVQSDIDTMVLRDPNISLRERRRHIYNNAHNAETERARRIIEMRKNREMAWSNQIKVDAKKEKVREEESWKKRLGLEDD